ncbi:hypothetical protein Bbelb_016020 [Branchiostoma belcheri]|nr:hypothetical protein Bbelb_016020 [Branchiostoma belcheri]
MAESAVLNGTFWIDTRATSSEATGPITLHLTATGTFIVYQRRVRMGQSVHQEAVPFYGSDVQTGERTSPPSPPATNSHHTRRPKGDTCSAAERYAPPLTSVPYTDVPGQLSALCVTAVESAASVC